MIGSLLGAPVATAEAFHDPAVPEGWLPLLPEEEPLVAGAVEERRREFAEVRACARRALGRLGV
ncbi:4'-phosphopantetheinyl transferase, partial [Streptomyces sp. NPDC005407]